MHHHLGDSNASGENAIERVIRLYKHRIVEPHGQPDVFVQRAVVLPFRGGLIVQLELVARLLGGARPVRRRYIQQARLRRHSEVCVKGRQTELLARGYDNGTTAPFLGFRGMYVDSLDFTVWRAYKSNGRIQAGLACLSMPSCLPRVLLYSEWSWSPAHCFANSGSAGVLSTCTWQATLPVVDHRPTWLASSACSFYLCANDRELLRRMTI